MNDGRRGAVYLLAALLGLVISFAQVRLAGGPDSRIYAMTALFDGARTNLGDPGPSIATARLLQEVPRARIYKAPSAAGASFIYPPLAALPYTALVTVSPATARARLATVNRILVVVIWILLIAIVRGAAGTIRWTEVIASGVVLWMYYPLMRAVELNQASVPVTALLGVSFVALQKQWARLAGLALAMTMAIKPHLLVMLPLLWWHSRAVVRWCLGSGVVLLLISVRYAGVDNHIDYVTRVLPALSSGYGFYPNQSWNGLFNRLVSAQDLKAFVLAPDSLMVRRLTLVCAVATYLIACFVIRRWRKQAEVTMWVLSVAWLVGTLISPVAWEHHYAAAVYVFALVYGTARGSSGTLPRAGLWLATASFVLLAGYFEVRNLEGTLPRLLVSYVFYGALLLGAGCVISAEHLRREASAGSVPVGFARCRSELGRRRDPGLA
jgi:hypothetical protein